MLKILSIIFPVFNEEQRLKKTFRAIELFKKPDIFSDIEIIFVDDGSNDRTAELIKNFRSRFSVRLIQYQPNRGKGYAVKTGMLEAKGDYALMLDIDMSTPLSEFEKFYPCIQNECPVIIGSRKMKGGVVEKAQPTYREFMGKCFTMLARTITGVKILDFTCGFKCFSKKAMADIWDKAKVERWSYDAEIIFLAKKMGYKICEVGIIWENDEHTKVRLGKDTLQSIWDLIKIRLTRY